MAVVSRSPLWQYMRRLIGGPGHATVSDQQLLERYRTNRDEAAFELVMWRHGPMVLNVCGRVLGDGHAAEDAFQATFVKLALKAGTIDKAQSVGSWLYKVAYRTALRVRQQADARSERERPLADAPMVAAAPTPDDEAADRELRRLLDAELRRLPEKYRQVIILCHLQGLTNEQAARELGCPKGTVLSRLARGRERLQRRLRRHNVTVDLLVLPVLIAHSCSELTLSADLVTATLRAASHSLAGSSGTTARLGGFGPSVTWLTAAVVALGLIVSSAGAFFHLSSPPGPTPQIQPGSVNGCPSRGCCTGRHP